MKVHAAWRSYWADSRCVPSASVVCLLQNLRDARSDCYRQGYQNGVTAFLATLSRRCDKGNACFDNGAAVGEYGARIFCDCE